MFEGLIHEWDGEEVVVRYDQPSGTWMFVGVHSTVLGPGMGGTRMKTYDAPSDGLRDVLRLSGAMTLKNSVARIPYGGGKAVLAVPSVPQGEERRRLLLRYAELVDSLGGTYIAAADMNTDADDMDVVGERCRYVLGRSPSHGGAGDPAPGTAVGVFHGILACAAYAYGTRDLDGRSVLVQGVGAVGGRLVELLHEVGAVLLVCDVDPARAREAADRFGAKVVDPEAAAETECDVYAPCATGAVLSSDSIPRLRCRIVAGAANNQLATPEDAARIRDAGVLYAPDYVINAGGVLNLAALETLGWTETQLAERLAAIGDTLTEVFRTAEGEGITTDAAAGRLARARIDAARSS